MKKAEIIEGFACYAPELALENDGFSVDTFRFLVSVEDRNFWFRSRNRVISYLVGNYLGKTESRKFLEIGCGTGYVLKGLQRLPNLELVGSEIYLKGLQYAKQRLPSVELIQVDATDMPFKNELDAVGAFDVIEHISEDEKVLTNIYKSLKIGGYAFISVPQYMHMWSYLDDLACHKRRYSRKELVSKMQAAGFQVEYVTGFVFLLFPLMRLSRALNRKKQLQAENEFSELRTGPAMNNFFSFFMRIDEALISAGIRLPWGGSLMIVGKKIK
jgi:SAM-dependent methyltransferase